MDQLHRDIVALAGTMTRQEIADTLRTSRPTVNRCLAKNKIRTGQPRQYPPEIVKSVMSFYETHTLNETQKAFPDIRVRSIVDRNNQRTKLDFWSLEERLYVLKNLGVKPLELIAKESKRTKPSLDHMMYRSYPNISTKHFNGIAYRLIKDHISIKRTDIKRHGNTYFVTWEQAYKYLDTEDIIVIDCISALAKFRRFLLDSEFT